MARQGELKGIERKKIAAVEAKADVYLKTVKRHRKATEDLKADKKALLDELKKHKLEETGYRTDDGLILTVGSTEKINVRDADDVQPGDEDDDEAGDDEPEASKEKN